MNIGFKSPSREAFLELAWGVRMQHFLDSAGQVMGG